VTKNWLELIGKSIQPPATVDEAIDRLMCVLEDEQKIMLTLMPKEDPIKINWTDFALTVIGLLFVGFLLAVIGPFPGEPALYENPWYYLRVCSMELAFGYMLRLMVSSYGSDHLSILPNSNSD
jgi:hypothetical protein